MAKYKLVPELDGIEIYFDEKPSADIRSKLVANRWRWNGVKGCWYTKQSQQAEKLAKELCGKASSEFISKPTPPIKSVGNSVSFEQKSNTSTTNISIKKEGNTYTWSSTNNQIACADCNRFFSIHAPACIFCGCPIIHTIKTHYNKQIVRKTQELQKQAEEREENRRKEELEYKKNAIKVFNKQHPIYIYGNNECTLLDLPIEKFKAIETRAKYLYKNKKQMVGLTTENWIKTVLLSENDFRQKVEELKEKKQQQNELAKIKEEEYRQQKEAFFNSLSKISISENLIVRLWEKGVTYDDVIERIQTINYFIKVYPYMNLDYEGYLLLSIDELCDYVKKHVKR